MFARTLSLLDRQLMAHGTVLERQVLVAMQSGQQVLPPTKKGPGITDITGPQGPTGGDLSVLPPAPRTRQGKVSGAAGSSPAEAEMVSLRRFSPGLGEYIPQTACFSVRVQTPYVRSL